MTPILMPDGRPWLTGFEISTTSNRVLYRGKEIPSREFLKRTGWTVHQVRNRMRLYGLTLDEAINVNPSGTRISPGVLSTWLSDVYRPWLASRTAGEAPAVSAPPNGHDAAPRPPESLTGVSQEVRVLRIEAVPPEQLTKFFEALADRLDAVDDKLNRILKQWE